VTYLFTDIPRGNSCHGLQTTAFADFTSGPYDGGISIRVQNHAAPPTTSTTTPPVVVQPAFTG
jgi:hypothetical protein